MNCDICDFNNKFDHQFLDTYTERNMLMQETFPKLKKLCKEKYDLEFQVCTTTMIDTLLFYSTFRYIITLYLICYIYIRAVARF